MNLRRFRGWIHDTFTVGFRPSQSMALGAFCLWALGMIVGLGLGLGDWTLTAIYAVISYVVMDWFVSYLRGIFRIPSYIETEGEDFE